MMSYPVFIDADKAAEFLGIAPSRLRWMRQNSRGPRHHVLPCGDIRYRPDELESWATAQRVAVTDRNNVIPFPSVKLARARKKLIEEEKPKPKTKPRRKLIRRSLAERLNRARLDQLSERRKGKEGSAKNKGE